MKILHLHRKPGPYHFSIEALFESLRSAMSKENVHAVYCPYPSQGFWPRVKNLLFTRQLAANVYHITGDVHYLALATPTRKTILTIHDLAFLQHPNPLARRLLYWFWLKLPVSASRIVTVISQATKDDLLRHLPACPPQKIRIIPNPVAERFQYTPKPFDQENPLVLMIGTKSNKNVERSFRALQGLSCRILLVGEKKDHLLRLADELNLNVDWRERLSDEELLTAYQDCDLLLFASTSEGFGMPIIEAQAVGRPVVTSNCSSMPEVAGEGACLVDPLEIASIREGLRQVIEDVPYREAIISAGRQNIERFRLNSIVQQYEKVYAELSQPLARTSPFSDTLPFEREEPGMG